MNGKCNVKKLRPKTILSSWCRLWGPEAPNTCGSGLNGRPQEAIGGERGGDVTQVLETVASQLDIAYMASLDFSFAFGSLVPQPVIQQMRQAGLPHGIAQMLTPL